MTGPDETATGETGPGAAHERASDLKDRLKAMTQPLVDSLDARLAKQVDAHLDRHLSERVNEVVSARLAVIERAIADLDRSLAELRAALATPDAETTPTPDAPA